MYNHDASIDESLDHWLWTCILDEDEQKRNIEDWGYVLEYPAKQTTDLLRKYSKLSKWDPCFFLGCKECPDGINVVYQPENRGRRVDFELDYRNVENVRCHWMGITSIIKYSNLEYIFSNIDYFLETGNLK